MSITSNINEALDRITPEVHEWYLTHFTSVNKDNPEDYFRLFLFAYLSVQMSWQNNVKLYDRLKDLSWLENYLELRTVFVEEKVGMHNKRPVFIQDFAEKFFQDPSSFHKRDEETWQDFRKRLDKRIRGLSTAKISFTMEMAEPTTEIVCFDRHMLHRIFEVKKTEHGVQCSDKDYKRFERMWLRECRKRNMLPAIARLAYWDTLQGYDNSLYWSQALNRR
jgi:thermostable 8-oxoguanine DNA glycosylase